MQKQASPGVGHLGKTRRGTVLDFRNSRQMRVAAELEYQHHEHQKRHEKMQTIEFRDAGEHEGNHGDAPFRVAELACKQESRKHVEDARRKGRSADDGHEPLAVLHVIQCTGTAQVEHHDVHASQKSKSVNSREIAGLGSGWLCRTICRVVFHGCQR